MSVFAVVCSEAVKGGKLEESYFRKLSEREESSHAKTLREKRSHILKLSEERRAIH